METYLDITKGLHTDFDEINQPVGTYRHLQNAIRQLSGSIESERGTTLIKTFAANDTRVIGSYVLDDQVVVFSFNPTTGLSEIGVLMPDDTYVVITSNTFLRFNLNTIIRAEGKKNFKGERIIYFTGKGLPMRVLNLDRVPTVDFDDNTKLVLTADMPQIHLSNVVEGGSLLTGIYQFGVRLLTKSTNSTAISILTNPIPVINDDASDRDKTDGAPPQSTSNKAIMLNISNIDTDYEYIEIIALTYIGGGNILKTTVVDRIPIQNRATISYTYSNSTQFKENLDTTALANNTLTYDSAEFIIQKDGVLVLGGLNSSIVDYNFQAAANKVTIKYAIRETVWNENINITGSGVDTGTTYPVNGDYKDPLVASEFKSYMRGETYSFAIVPIFKNWVEGAAYHIPAPYVQSFGNSSANTTTKELGTFMSTEIYPTGKGYPDTSSNRVRHHTMPTLQQEPHVQRRNGITYIRMLGLSIDLTAMLAEIPDIIKAQVIGYSVVKQKRDKTNSSILAQGVATGHANFNNTSGLQYNALPFAGNYPIASHTNDINMSLVAFYSPETIITKEDMTTATTIKPVIQLSGNVKLVSSGSGRPGFIHTLHDYNNVTAVGSDSLTNLSRSINTSVTRYTQPGQSENIPSLGKTLGLDDNPGYLFLNVPNNLPIANTTIGGKGDVYIELFATASTATSIFINNNRTSTYGSSYRHLYNLTKYIDAQYGSVYNAKYHYVKHVMVTDIPASNLLECFNGDIFITKFAVMSASLFGGNSLLLTNAKSINYFWVESTINCGYRHYQAVVGTEGQPGFIPGTLPYYPKVKVLHSTDNNAPGLFDYSLNLGHATGYNKQYSFENTIKPYFPLALELEQVTSFPNRLLYSEQSVEGEQFDAFRVFLPNNFHDIPKEKGKITNIFNLSNTIHVHTERSLWKTHFNEQVSQASSAGEVYLGNGGVFDRPSTEIISVKGGYAGTTSSSGTTTPFGHLFVDSIQKKVFMFSDELKEISDQGMFKYFKANLENRPDTPALNDGYSSVFDYANKRWLLTRLGHWTLSYSIQLNSWSSFHDYIPYHYITNGARLLSVNENIIHENNVGLYGVYYENIPSSLQIDIVINDAPKETKTFDNLIFHTTSQNNNSKEQHYDTFNTLQVYNTTKNTGKCRLIVPKTFEDEFINLNLFEAFAKLKSNEFRIAIPNDLVLDVEGDIFASTNLDTTRSYRPRMSGKYMVASLSYNNLRNNRFVLHNIGRLFRQRVR